MIEVASGDRGGAREFRSKARSVKVRAKRNGSGGFSRPRTSVEERSPRRVLSRQRGCLCNVRVGRTRSDRDLAVAVQQDRPTGCRDRQEGTG